MKKEIKDLIDKGADIEFSYNGKEYTLLAWIDKGISVGEKNNDADDNIFSDYDDLMNNFIIDGKPFKDIVDDIIITFSS